MTNEGPAFGRSASPVEAYDQPDVDAELDQVDGADAAELDGGDWEQDWKNTIEAVKPWGSRLAGAYSEARAEAGGTVHQRYDGEGSRMSMSATEKAAYKLQPDIVIVDLESPTRTWRHPIAGEVREKVALAGWTISRREIASPDGSVEPPKPVATKPKAGVRGSLIEALESEEPTDKQDDEPEADKTTNANVWVEHVVLMNNGRIMRFVGKSDAAPDPDAPLRFARKRPDESLKPENDEDDPKATARYAKQVATIDEYADKNKHRFVDPASFDLAAVLTADDILDADLGQLPDSAPEGLPSDELEAWMVRAGMHKFLSERHLADGDELAQFAY